MNAMPSRKRLSDEVAESFPQHRSVHEACFIQLLDEVLEALNKSHKMTRLHEHLKRKGRVHFGYDTFRRYVSKHIKWNGECYVRKRVVPSATSAEQAPVARTKPPKRPTASNPLLERRERPPSTAKPSGKADDLY